MSKGLLNPISLQFSEFFQLWTKLDMRRGPPLVMHQPRIGNTPSLTHSKSNFSWVLHNIFPIFLDSCYKTTCSTHQNTKLSYLILFFLKKTTHQNTKSSYLILFFSQKNTVLLFFSVKGMSKGMSWVPEWTWTWT